MNRKDRRADRSRERREAARAAADAPVHDLVTLAARYRHEGRHRDAVKLLAQVIAREPGHAGAHDGLALSYLALGRGEDAVRHFTEAISLGLVGAEALVKQSPAIMAVLGRIAWSFPQQLALPDLVGTGGAGSVGGDALLLALLQTRVVCDLELERLLTELRRALLREAGSATFAATVSRWFGLACALAHQCFMNEYVLPLTDDERSQLTPLRDRIVEALSDGTGIVPDELAILACYEPVHGLPFAERLDERPWPRRLDELLTRQLREPLAELADRPTIPALTEVEDAVSRQVRDQYEENPYPRWTVPQPVRATSLAEFLCGRFGLAATGILGRDILIAGCGTGEHAIETARRFPEAKLLAVDINRNGLAYARRKSRELGVANVEYAVADILKLGELDRRFDLIESVGVLHHLEDPEAGWQVLLSLLRPGGVMRIGLYSALGRTQLDAGRALIAERGYQPTADDIRRWRQELIRANRPIASSDFFSTSGCRDLCFNVMEHRFTLPRIDAFLKANRLTLLGMEAPAEVREQFTRLNPEPDAGTDLSRWDRFEQSHPRAFEGMYFFWARCSTSVALMVWMHHGTTLARIVRHLGLAMVA